MTKRLWQIHSWMGLIAGIGLLVIGLTGSLLVFRDELETLFNPKLARSEPTPEGRQSLDAIFRAVNVALPDEEIVGWSCRENPRVADTLYVVHRGDHEWRGAMVDPYSATVLGGPVEFSHTLTGWLLELHYEFFGGVAGMAVTGLLAVLLCLLGLSGIWLYRSFWKNFFLLRWRASSRIFFSSLHKSVGITFVLFNLILGFTGAWWNLTDVLGHLRGAEPEPANITAPLYNRQLDFEQLLKTAREKLPGFHVTFISLPDDAAEDICFNGRTPSASPLRSDYGSMVTFDAQTGAFKSATDIRQLGLGAQILDAFYPLHFGTFGGLFIKILWCIGGLTPGLLGVSGFIIWRKRRAAAQVHKTHQPRFDH